MIVELDDGGRIDLVQREVVGREVSQPLREKEAAVLRMLLVTPGEVVTREALEVEVFGYGTGATTRTVDTTMRRLRRALEPVGASSSIQTVYGEGYRWCGPLPGRGSRVGIRGRGPLLAQAAEWVEGTGALLVISGPGGMGKTLLAREVAVRATASIWVGLADVADVAAAVDRVADVLGAPRDAVGARLALDGALLVLDDCDALDPAMGTVVADWILAGARVVLTRRVALPWPGAVTLRLEGLSLDDTRQLWEAEQGDADSVPEVWSHTAGHPLSILLLARLSRDLDVRPVLRSEALERQLVDPGQLNPRHRSLSSLFASTLEDLPPSAVWLLGLLCLPEDDLPQSWLTWLAERRSHVLADLAALRDAGLLTIRDGCVSIHRMFRVLALADVSAADREEHVLLWVEWTRRCAMAWLTDRSPAPPTGELLRSFDQAVQNGAIEHAGPLLYVLARRAELAARPQDPQQMRLQRFVERGGGGPWAALTEALLGLNQHPVDLELGTRAVEASRQTPWRSHAHLLRAALHARTGDGSGVKREVEAAEQAASILGERAVARTWLEAAEILSYVDIDAARRRLEMSESLLHLLDINDRLKWHRAAAVVYGQLLDTRRHLRVTTAAATLASRMDPAERAASLAQLGSARWNVGDLQGAMEAVETSVELSRAARPWIRVMCCNNLCALRQQSLDWEGMRAAMALGVARAGTDPRAQELARRLCSATRRYLGDAPVGITPDAMAAQLGTTDTGWFLWRAQVGESDVAVSLAEEMLLPLDREPLRSGRVRRLIDLATLYLSVERFQDAVEVLDRVLHVLPMKAPNRFPAEAARAFAGSRCVGRPRRRPPRQPAPSPLLQLEVDLWQCALDRDAERLATLRRGQHLLPGGELAWRFDFTARLNLVQGT